MLLLTLACSPAAHDEPDMSMAGAPTVPSASGRRRVLFLGGQSNAIAQDGTEPPSKIFEATMIVKILGPEGFEVDTVHEEPLGPLLGRHSLELAAVTKLEAVGQVVSVVKVARGSSWLGEWLPTSPSHYWDSIVEAKSRADVTWGSDVDWSFVWLQSESDVAYGVRTEQYEANLRLFVGHVRELFGPVHFYQCKLQPSQGAKNGLGKVIRDAQTKVMAESPLNHLLDFDDLNGQLHYTSPQLNVMGERAAAAIMAE